MKRGAVVLPLLILVAYLATGLYEVRPGERAVVRRFGRVLDETGLPGLNVGLPWGLDRVDRVAVDEQRRLEVGFQPGAANDPAPAGEVLTGDNHLIDLRATVYYRIDPARVVDFVLHQERVEPILQRAAEGALAAVLAGYRIDPVLLGQARDLEPRLQAHLVNALQPYQIGVLVEGVNLTSAQPPKDLAEIFLEVNRARTQKEIDERKALGERQTTVSIARQEAQTTRTGAQVAAHDRLSRARAEAANFLALWQRVREGDVSAATLTIYLKEMQAIVGRFQVRTITDPNVNPTVVLPLPEK
jgi:membrane protease subunit HflK